MKKILSLLGLLIVVSACKKHTFDEALPKVVIQSVVSHGSDSLLITGNFTSTGVGKMDYVGFCYGTTPNPDIPLNQVLGNGTTSAFSAVVAAVQDSTYYFKAFAANEFGYAASNVIKYTVPTAAPAIAPCTLTNNQFTDNGSTFGVFALGSSVNPQYGNYTVTLYGTNEDIMISFPNAPHNGIYTTTTDGSHLSANQVYITISNFNQYTINSGQSLYISATSTDTTLSACALHYGSATMYGKASY